MTNIDIGNFGELLVLQEFIKNGIQCYLPYGNGSRVDLIADFNNKLNKIQIKTCEKAVDGAMEWKVGGGAHHKVYKADEVDYFALCCIQESIICFVPYNNQTASIKIRLDNYNGIKTYNMHFASECSLLNILNKSIY